MPTSAPTPLRQVLEERVRQLVLDTENLFAESRDRARRDMAEQLNQAVRRIRQTSNLEDLRATLVDATAPFCSSSALFAVSGDLATGDRIRGVSDATTREFGWLQLPLASAPALAGAVESRDPMVTATTPGEISAALAKVLEHGPTGRAAIYPLVARDGVPALLYTWGTPHQGPAIELLAQVASSVWAALTEPVPEPTPPEPAADGLVNIAPAPTEPATASSWDQLPLEEQRIHLRAQRFARVQVSEMRLFEPDAVQSGRARRAIYDALRTQIDTARQTFRTSFFAPCPSMVDYLHLELVRTLANDNPDLLGGDYPGPLV
jgi:DNA gyrase/topoisomerase IV subunit B